MNQGPRTGLRQKPGDDGDTGDDGVRALSLRRKEGVGGWPMDASSTVRATWVRRLAPTVSRATCGSAATTHDETLTVTGCPARSDGSVTRGRAAAAGPLRRPTVPA
ncbi:hypothetical protein GCM10010252_60120 [Streptomyces aureoverticillatus]|nr:hypothetical protein GCM10010252_60120 [Streptomyces aureoverticillatus]